MKIALIIVTIIFALSFIIRRELFNTAKYSPLDYINNHKAYDLIATVNGIVFLLSLVAEIVLLVLIFVK